VRAIQSHNRFSSKSSCEIERKNLVSAVSRQHRILESSCKAIRVPNYRNRMDTLYQAVAVVLDATVPFPSTGG
jgi:hypothetical protein